MRAYCAVQPAACMSVKEALDLIICGQGLEVDATLVGGAALADRVEKLKWLRGKFILLEGGNVVYRMLFCD